MVGVPGPYRIAGDVVRWVGTGLLIWSAVWVTARAKEDRDVWRGAVLILSVYFLVTPWFLYWYLVAPIALLALMPRDRLMPATITASGTLLITTAFWPWLLAQIIEVTLRYAPPLYVYARLGRRRTGTVGAAPVVDAPGPGVEPLPTPASPESSTVRAVSRRWPAAIRPSAESTPLARGQTIREISSSSASAAACIGPAPPNGSRA